MSDHRVFSLATGYRLQWEEAQNMFVLLYPEGLVELNQSSAEILTACNGEDTVDDIIKQLETKFDTSGLSADIKQFLDIATNNGWLQQN